MHSKYIYNSTILVLTIFSCTAHGINLGVKILRYHSVSSFPCLWNLPVPPWTLCYLISTLLGQEKKNHATRKILIPVCNRTSEKAMTYMYCKCSNIAYL